MEKDTKKLVVDFAAMLIGAVSLLLVLAFIVVIQFTSRLDKIEADIKAQKEYSQELRTYIDDTAADNYQDMERLVDGYAHIISEGVWYDPD